MGTTPAEERLHALPGAQPPWPHSGWKRTLPGSFSRQMQYGLPVKPESLDHAERKYPIPLAQTPFHPPPRHGPGCATWHSLTSSWLGLRDVATPTSSLLSLRDATIHAAVHLSRTPEQTANLTGLPRPFGPRNDELSRQKRRARRGGTPPHHHCEVRRDVTTPAPSLRGAKRRGKSHPGRNSLIKNRVAVFPHWAWIQSWTDSCSLASQTSALALAYCPPESITFPREKIV